jgi:peptidoglycan hydrolase-like protein with peptidoglycan-binding domain
VRDVLVMAGEGVLRNPLAVGGTTAFLVAFSFVSANALWYQPHFHGGAFFSTRAMAPAAPQRAAAPAPAPDATLGRVQAALSELKFYAGAVDGLSGPQTRKAIEDYQKSAGLNPSGTLDDALLARLGIAGHAPAAAVSTGPVPPERAPQPMARPSIDTATTQSVEPGAAPDVVARNIRIQAGLKAFGNDAIELDGIIGPRTKAAIREFQSLFGLAVTGEPDEALLTKMRQVGLTN